MAVVEASGRQRRTAVPLRFSPVTGLAGLLIQHGAGSKRRAIPRKRVLLRVGPLRSLCDRRRNPQTDRQNPELDTTITIWGESEGHESLRLLIRDSVARAVRREQTPGGHCN